MSTIRSAVPYVAACLLLSAAAAVAQPGGVAAAVSAPDAAAGCEVWARELGFARSVAEHDAHAFAEHVHEGAVFGPGTSQPAHGRDAVVRQWTGLIEGKGLRLSWYPARVLVAGTGDHAWSTGPALYEDLSPDAERRYSLGQFNSVWHRASDGVWRVLFDDGIPPQPATEADVEAFRAGRREDCKAD